jgi:hypothetical protein
MTIDAVIAIKKLNVKVFEIIPIKPNLLRVYAVVTDGDSQSTYEIALNVGEFVSVKEPLHFEIDQDKFMHAVTNVIADTKQTAEIAKILSSVDLEWDITELPVAQSPLATHEVAYGGS